MAAPMNTWCRRAKFYYLGLKLPKRQIWCSCTVKNARQRLLHSRKFPDNVQLRLKLNKAYFLLDNIRSLTTKPTHKEIAEVSKKANQKNYESVTYDLPTLPGEKKDITCPLPKAHSPEFVEAAWYAWWVKQGFFTPEYQRNNIYTTTQKKLFVLCLPPPNVTGSLHLGHALTNSIQDAIVRWHRMHGKETVWIPGSDHAGIATQVVVEKKLWQEQGKTRHDLGREPFIQEVWKWKNEKGDTIYKQMKMLGSSLDWSRSHFTMDEDLSHAVTEAFIRLHDEGLIYRANSLVNWCCQLKSAISDIEVDNVNLPGKTKLTVPGYDKPVEFGTLVSFAYPVNGTDEEIVVSTTRPETMLGDTAIAIHPHDNRYKHLRGNHAKHPIEDRLLPIICDEFVDQTFGTGVVKVTPDHDYTDFDVGVRHKLPSVTVIDEDGHMMNVNQEFMGMKRFHARIAVIKKLKELGLYRETKSHEMTVPMCSRTKDIIEPRLMEQWYVNCVDMAKEAVKAIENKELRIHPEFYDKIWTERLENIRDWCISRQLWWGHRIPAYQASVIGKTNSSIWIGARNDNEAMEKASKVLSVPTDQISVKQDEDVLDTWFSSGLFPFSVFGWPNKTEDFDRYYPTSLLETGSDIWFFWGARMVMLGLKLTGKLPFSQVLLHGLLKDAHGRKMSKSLGNVIDPVDVIQGTTLQALHKQLETGNLDPAEITKAKAGQKQDFPNGIPQCGADALRFSLCSYDFKAPEINMDIKMIQGNRHFCNKVWQGYKFVVSNLGQNFTPVQIKSLDDKIDEWILSRLSHLIESCEVNFRSYDLQVVTKNLKAFWISEFCDVYLEYVKPVLWGEENGRKQSVQQVLYKCVDVYLRALSPFMPYLSEELYQRLPHGDDHDVPSVCVAPFPSQSEVSYRNKSLEEEMYLVNSICNKVLSVASNYQIKWHQIPVHLRINDRNLHESLKHQSYTDALKILSRSKSIHFLSDEDVIPPGSIREEVGNGIKIFPVLKGLINPVDVTEILRNKQTKLEVSIQKLHKQIQSKQRKENINMNSGSTDDASHKKIRDLELQLQKLKESITSIEQL